MIRGKKKTAFESGRNLVKKMRNLAAFFGGNM